MGTYILPIEFDLGNVATSVVELLLKMTLVLAAALLGCRLWRSSSAAVRHHLLALAMLSALLIPVASLAIPEWNVARIPASGWLFGLPSLEASVPDIVGRLGPGTATEMAANSAPEQSETSLVRMAGVGSVDVTTHPARKVLATLLLAGWAAGFVFVAFRSVCAVVGVRRLFANSHSIHDRNWNRLLVESVAEIGLRRSVSLRRSDDCVSPLACGLANPFVLLPGECDQWGEAERRSVLLHELAHLKRHDVLVFWMTQLVLLLYWFHPLVWLVRRQMRVERELACDDVVTQLGVNPNDYAAVLVEMASRFNRRVGAFPALPMASPGQLAYRVKRLLDDGAARGPLSRRLAITGLALVIGASVVLASLSGAVAQEPKPKKVASGVGDRSVDSAEKSQERESTEQGVYFTDGLLPIGQHTLDRDDLDLVSAIKVVGAEHVQDRGHDVSIIRRKVDGRLVVIYCDLRNARSDPSANPLIQSGDVIVMNPTIPKAQTPKKSALRVRYQRIPILGPTTKGGAPVAGDPPSDDEIVNEMRKADHYRNTFDALVANPGIRIIKEKIADYIDPPRFYPLIGPAQLHHAHYKCTVYFGGTTGEDPAKREVVYIDHNHFHMIEDRAKSK